MIQSIRLPVAHESSNDALNFLMRGELAAAETYRHAISAITGEATAVDLNRCLRSHDLRAVRLAEHITLAGGTPLSGHGQWGAPARGPDEWAGNRTTRLAALEEDERQGLSDYRAVLDQVDDAGVALMRQDLMPEQVRTLGIASMLCRRHAM